MPPVHHGRFTLNVDRSVMVRDNSGRYAVVALDEWEDGEIIDCKVTPMPDPIHASVVGQIIAGLNSGKRAPRFNL